MSPYRDQDPVDVVGELRKVRDEMRRLRHDAVLEHELLRDDVRFIRHALERPKWRPSVPTFCFALAVAAVVASIVARAVYP